MRLCDDNYIVPSPPVLSTFISKFPSELSYKWISVQIRRRALDLCGEILYNCLREIFPLNTKVSALMKNIPDAFFTAPVVYAVGNSYQIMVPVSCETLMWVAVGDRCYYDDSNGILRSAVTTH